MVGNKQIKFGRISTRYIIICLVLVIIYEATQYNVKDFLPGAKSNKLDIKQQNIPDPEIEHPSSCVIAPLQSRSQFYDYFKTREYNCKSMRLFGRKDGAKAVCFDTEFYLVPDDCHVLSFGIDNEWSFDDQLAKQSCKVYSFDPTMADKDHQRSANVQFFRLGISNITGKRRVGMGKKFDYFEVDRYENILARLGLTNKRIDYLKLDVELSELDFFQDVFKNSPHLLKNIKQISMELHHGYHGEGLNKTKVYVEGSDLDPSSTYHIFWQYFQQLRCHGFKLFFSRKNRGWTEVVWVNV